MLLIIPGLNDQCNGNIALHDSFSSSMPFRDLVQNKKSNIHSSNDENDSMIKLDDAYCHICR